MISDRAEDDQVHRTPTHSMEAAVPSQFDYGPRTAGERVSRAFGRISASEFDRTIADLLVHQERRMAEVTAFTAENEAFQQVTEYVRAQRATNAVQAAELTSVKTSLVEKDAALAAASAQLADVQAQLSAEQASRNDEIKRQVDAALELDAQKDTERVLALLSDAAEVPVPGDLPVEEPPVVETPPAGEPAEVPTDDSGSPVFEPVDESTLPETDTSVTEVPASDSGDGFSS